MQYRALRAGTTYSLLFVAAWGFLAAVVAADPTGATEVVQQAAREGGWMAAALCVIGMTMVSGLIVLVRNLMERQDKTETFLRVEMARLILHMSEVTDDNTLERARLARAITQAAAKMRCVHDADVAAVVGEGDSERDNGTLGETGRRVLERRAEREQRKSQPG